MNQILRRQTSRSHYGSKVPAVTVTVSKYKRTPAIIFGQILELYYLETLKRTRLEIFCYQKQYRHSLRTVGDSQKEHTHSHPHLHPSPIFYFSVIIIFLYRKCLYTLIIRHALCQTFVCMILERNSTCVQSYCMHDNKICLNQ